MVWKDRKMPRLRPLEQFESDLNDDVIKEGTLIQVEYEHRNSTRGFFYRIGILGKSIQEEEEAPEQIKEEQNKRKYATFLHRYPPENYIKGFDIIVGLGEAEKQGISGYRLVAVD